MRDKIAFYKYKPYKSNKDLRFLEDYLSQKVWMRRLDEFNDPFEGTIKYTPISLNMLENNKELFDHFFQSLKKAEHCTTEEEFKKLIKNPEFIELHKEHFKKYINNIFPSHSALCLTACASNIPMWAHYGNEHTGYCLIYEFNLDEIGVPDNIKQRHKDDLISGDEVLPYSSKFDEKLRFAFTKINYNKVIPTVGLHEYLRQKKLSEYDANKYIIKNSVGVKFEQWAYENEYRLVTNSNSTTCGLMPLPGFAPFLKVVGLIMGSKLKNNPVLITQFEELSKKYKVDLYQAEPSHEEYKMTIRQIVEYGNNSSSLFSICQCGCLKK